MISVRLSEEEYAALRRVSSLTGGRSVSDLTRDAMLSFLRGVNREDSPESNFEGFRADMKCLEEKVQRLEAKITTFKAGSND